MRLADLTFLVMDTETTGLDPRADKVCSIAGVWTSLARGGFRRESSLVDPCIPIPPEASAIHHIVDRHVAGAPTLAQVLPAFQGDDFQAYAAHNAAFDFGFLPSKGRPVVCTMRLARKVWPGLSRYSNQYLRYFLRLEVPEAEGLPAHEALSDALVTSRLLLAELAWLEEHPQPGLETLEDLVAWIESPNLLETCNFGSKHRGTPWAKVPKDYLAWMKREVKDMDPDTRFTVDHYLQKV